jgi:hypothetical protein
MSRTGSGGRTAAVTRRGLAFGFTNALFTLAFLFSIVVQLNDPDPFAWVLIYGIAAVACVLAQLRRGHWLLPAAIATGAGVWALTIAPRVIGQVRFLDMFGAFEMENVGIEESRELYGLLIILVWMVVLTVRQVRRSVERRGHG